MKKMIFQLISSTILFGLLFLPFFLPNTITGNVNNHEDIFIELYNSWAIVSVTFMFIAVAEYIWSLTDKIYMWLTKDLRK